MAEVAGESSVMVVMPSKPNLQRPAPLSLPFSTPTTNPDSDDVQATPENSGSKRKRRSTDDGSTTDEEGDVSKSLYECRFCNMRFAKSQALGGHMNRHRQEREKEQYQQAQQLVSSMAHQQMPRTWNTMADLSSSNAGAAAAARLRLQLGATGAPASRPDGSSPHSRGLPITTTSTPAMHDSSPGNNYYLPSNSSSNNLQHLQWNVEGFNANHGTGLPRTGSQQGLSALDSMTAGMRDDFLLGVLPPRGHDSSQFGCPAPFSTSVSMPLLHSRPGLATTVPGTFHGGGLDSSIPGGHGSPGLVFSHDHQSMRMNEMMRHLSSSSPSTLMQQTNFDTKPGSNGGRISAASPTLVMQSNNLLQFKQPQGPGPRPLQSSTAAGPYHAISPPSMFSGHSFNTPAPSPNFGALVATNDFNALHEFESQMNTGMGMQGQYSLPRPAIAQTSSGSAASGSFGVSAEGPGVYGHVKLMEADGDGYNQLCVNQDHPALDSLDSAGVLSHSHAHSHSQSQPLTTGGAVVHEVLDGNHCESMNITTVTDQSGDVSGLSAPARYQSTDFSSGSPECRTQNGSPSAQANRASPRSQGYCSA